MKKRYFCFYGIIISACLLLTSCISVKYPDRTQYMLNAAKPQPVYRIPSKNTLTIYNITSAQQFSSLAFVYRTSDINYTRDYYNIFFNSPSDQIQDQMVKYLAATNLFQHVTDEINIFHTTYSLRSKVIELYADYRDSNQPKAVMTIKFMVFRGTKSKIVLAKTITSSAPLATKSTRALVEAWNNDLAIILAQLTTDLKKLS